MTIVGLVSPGEMGASVGAAASPNVDSVIWAGDDRSKASHERADAAGLINCGKLENLTQQSDVILSICPPHDTESVVRSISNLQFPGLFVDCNAISPEKTCQLSNSFKFGHYIDGGIVGGPAWKKESGTRLYLSGNQAGPIAELFSESPLLTSILSEDVGHASALKMVFAAYTKGSIALLTAILGVAESQGIRHVLEQQWGSDFTEQTHQRLVATAVKGWRFEAEMHEIANTFSAAGFPEGFHRAAADIYAKTKVFKNNQPESIKQLLQALRPPS